MGKQGKERKQKGISGTTRLYKTGEVSLSRPGELWRTLWQSEVPADVRE